MLNSSDFLFLPFPPELTQAGIAYTCQSLPDRSTKGNERGYFELRSKVASTAAKLAFHRLLEACNIPHRNVTLKPFTNPDETDISIHGRRIEWINFLISRPRSIQRVIRAPESILSEPLIVNLPEADLKLIQDQDLLFFSISLGRTTAHLSELHKVASMDRGKYLIYSLPVRWADPEQVRSLGRLVLKSEHGPDMNVELGGRDERGVLLVLSQVLPKRVRIEIERELYSLTYLHVSELPAGRISIYSPNLRQLCTIHAHEWGNLWIYGSSIALIGYIAWDEFKCNSYELSAGMFVMGEMRLPVKCRAVETQHLHPIRDLIPRIKEQLLNI